MVAQLETVDASMVCSARDGEVAVGGAKKVNVKKSVEGEASGHGDC